MTLPIDCDRNKRSLRVKTISLDLTKPESWQTLRYIIQNCNVASVHVAPPCGTCSRAREKRLNDQQHLPRPLRNERFPYGTPGLRLHEEVRVKAANSLYMHMSKFCLWLIEMKVPFTIENPENPTNSWLWKLPRMKELVNKCYVSTFHSLHRGAPTQVQIHIYADRTISAAGQTVPRRSPPPAVGTRRRRQFCDSIIMS